MVCSTVAVKLLWFPTISDGVFKRRVGYAVVERVEFLFFVIRFEGWDRNLRTRCRSRHVEIPAFEVKTCRSSQGGRGCSLGKTTSSPYLKDIY